MRLFIRYGLVSMLIFALAACGRSDTTPTPTPSPSPSPSPLPTPDPTTPDPTSPDPTTPDPTTPDPTIPDPTTPDPTTPDPTSPDPTVPDPSVPDPTTPDPTSPSENTISGTITAPAGGDVSGTLVAACLDATCNSDVNTTVGADGSYVIGNLQASPYIVIAIKDVNNSGSINDGDYIGFYSTNGSDPTTVTPPVSNVNITLSVYDEDDTEPEEPGASIGGNVIAPSGASLAAGTVVVACYETGGDCDEDLSGFVELAGTGTSVAYSITDLTGGSYTMFAFSDANGNGDPFDADDYAGTYSSAVTPPANGIDITLSAADAQSSALMESARKVQYFGSDLFTQAFRALRTGP